MTDPVRLAIFESDLSLTQRLVVSVLLHCQEVHEDVSLTRLQSMAGMSRSGVCRILNSLEDAGWIRRERGRRGLAVTQYEVTPPSLTSRGLDSGVFERPQP